MSIATATATPVANKPIFAAIDAVKTGKLWRNRDAIARYISAGWKLDNRPDNMGKWAYCQMLADLVMGKTR